MVKYMGTATSGGLTIAKIKIINRRITGFKRVTLAAHREKALLDSAIILAKDELARLMADQNKEQQDILNFQLVMLDDKGLKESIFNKIERNLGAARSVEEAMEEYCKRLHDLNDEYISSRSSDIRDVLTRVVDILDGKSTKRFSLTEAVIVVADEILPSDLASIDRDLARGFITVGGAYQSHANIIARTMGIPSVCNVSQEILNPLYDGKLVALDGYTGEIFLVPNEAVLALFNHKISLERRETIAIQSVKHTNVIHTDGEEVSIYANCNDPKDISLAIANGAQGIGLVRSEVLFMSNTYNLSMASQIDFYCKCIEAAENLPITIRAFDIGADKPLGGVSSDKEDNPALGLRGVRLIYSHPELFITQIQAFFISADRLGRKINVMIPMVTTTKEVIDYLNLVDEVRIDLMAKNIISCDNLVWGIMIETPAAALISHKLARLVSFFSIGTNDLTQYTLAADRTNFSVRDFYNHNHEAILQLINMTVKSAQDAGIPVSVCGESAADFEAARLYVDMGIRCISMAGNAMISIKHHLIDCYNLNVQ